VLGFAAGEEGGAQTASRLAARRARAVALELAKLGIERDRVRAEARTRGFASGGVDRRPGARVILLPVERNPA
jgi:coenzyme F420-reducing hydrogenase delta subunit